MASSPLLAAFSVQQNYVPVIDALRLAAADL
jgi:hypothetical protein